MCVIKNGKEKIKKIFKTRAFIFVTTALFFSTIGVSAATYFPSNDVTYDNKESGLSSTNVQGAIDELYNTCTGSSSSSDLKRDTVISGDGLYKDEYEDGRYFFKGTDPNNYIVFAGRMWRIISVEANGTLKILKTDSVGTGYGSQSGAYSMANDYYNYWISDIDKSKIVKGNFGYGKIKTSHYDDLENIIGDENSKYIQDT